MIYTLARATYALGTLWWRLKGWAGIPGLMAWLDCEMVGCYPSPPGEIVAWLYDAGYITRPPPHYHRGRHRR